MLPVLKWMVVQNKCATNPVAEAGSGRSRLTTALKLHNFPRLYLLDKLSVVKGKLKQSPSSRAEDFIQVEPRKLAGNSNSLSDQREKYSLPIGREP